MIKVILVILKLLTKSLLNQNDYIITIKLSNYIIFVAIDVIILPPNLFIQSLATL